MTASRVEVFVLRRLLEGIEILQVAAEDAAPVCRRAVDLAGQVAVQLGAAVQVDAHFHVGSHFLGRGKRAAAQSVAYWLQNSSKRYLLAAASDDSAESFTAHSAVVLQSDARASEATLFADAGFADLLGDPGRAPIIPQGDYGSGTAAYAVLAALASLICKQRRFSQTESARIDAAGVISWVNWKAAAAGQMGRDLRREGERAEWPVIRCADGCVALVYVERDWRRLVDVIGDERLTDAKFNSAKNRHTHRDECMNYLREWAQQHTKQALNELFNKHHIPAAAIMTCADLLRDPLMKHREAFVPQVRDSGVRCLSPVLPHRIVAVSERSAAQETVDSDVPALPLAGMRVLDLGIITAGAGVSALLADLGAEVLKVESHTYPDPFRQWAGDEVSPLFKCNNRNKYGIAIDLKTEAGKAQFLRLAETADLVLENFRRGVLDRLGLTYDVLRQANPNIVLASISGQGLDGPGSGSTSYGSTLEATSGFAAKACYEDGVPYITGRNVNYPDQTVVLYAAAVLTAVLSQPQRGMHIDVSQRDVAVFLSGEELELLSAGEPGQLGSNGHAYQTADERWVAFDDTGVLPVASAAQLADWVAERSVEEVIAALGDLGIGAAVVRRGSEMYAALNAARSSEFAHSPNGDLVKGFPFQLRRTPMTIRLDSPAVGEHNSQFVSA